MKKIRELRSSAATLDQKRQNIRNLMMYIHGGTTLQTKELRMIWAGCYIDPQDSNIVWVNAHRIHKVTKASNAAVTEYLKKRLRKPLTEIDINETRLNTLLQNYKLGTKGWVQYDSKVMKL